MGKYNMTIGQVLGETARRFPGRPALIGEGFRCSYRELDEYSECAADRLWAQGVGRGAHVGVWANDQPAAFLCFCAVWKLGAVLLPLCTGYTKEEMLHCVQAADIDVIVADGEYLETLRRFELPVKILPLRTLTENLSPPTEKVERSEARCEDMDTILFTSGSTGKAKPVCTNHLARVNTMFAQAAALDADETDIFCMALPMYHCFSLTAMALAAVAVGACLCFPPDRKGRTILRTIEKERCTVLTAVPTLFSVLLKRYREEPCDLSSLQTGMIGGSTYSPQLYQEICRTFDFTLLPSLGQTEASAGITSCAIDDPPELRLTTVGRFFQTVEGCIRSVRTGEILPPGEEGEICLSGPTVMLGYLDNPKETALVLQRHNDGRIWLHTGDLGCMDTDGFVYFRQRIKRMIITSGYNVYPSQLENIIDGNENVLLSCVIGVKDPYKMQKVKAFVVLKPGVAPTEAVRQDLMAYCRKRIAKYAMPYEIEFREELPKTLVGKVAYRVLEEEAEKEQNT